ncbi:MAG: hypothetical protein J6L69_08765 [Lachnospiraceae bacterium]|nr:hypothetical protein [Lachnospiraceae bacterium]
MKKLLKRVALVLCMIIIALSVSEPFETYAKLPYLTYTQNGYGQYVETQAAYTPHTTISKITSEIEGIDDMRFEEPSDIKITDDGYMYICDKKNARIIVATTDGKLDRVIGEEWLEEPTGVFVIDNEDDGYTYVYVADNKMAREEMNSDRKERKRNGAVVVFKYKKGTPVELIPQDPIYYEATGVWEEQPPIIDYKWEVDRYYLKPESPLYGAGRFNPMKIAVDQSGIMYIISEGNTNGIVQISPEEGGTFLGYFGANEITVSLGYMITEFFMSDDSTAIRGVADTPSNVNVDEDGLVYTITASEGTLQSVKKLNKSGANMLKTEVNPTFGVGIAPGRYNNVYAVTSTGYIYEYTSEGTLLFRFGGKDDQAFRVGLFANISAVDVDNNDYLYVMDSINNEIQVFKPTEFTQLVHESLVLYQNGRYSDSKKPLEQLILMNSLFDYANEAMGHAYFQEENYEQALYYYRLAKEKQGYSDSFWELRNDWLTSNLIYLIVIIVIFWLIFKVLGKIDKKTGLFNVYRRMWKKLKKNKLISQIAYCKTYATHPIDGAYAVKREGMVSYGAITFLMILFMVIMIVNKYFSGFLVKNMRDGVYYIPTDILTVVFGFVFASAVTYLICTISDGEGRFKEILMGYLYSFTPYFIIQPIIYLGGMIVTTNEMFLIQFANIIMFVWIAILLFLTIKEINNYTVKETFKVIGITIFAAVVFVAIAFILYILAAQVINFVKSIYGEVVYRLEK